MKKIYFVLLAVLALTVTSFNFISVNETSKIEKYAPPNSGGPAVSGNGDRTGSPLSIGNCASCHSGGNFTPTMNIFITDTLGNQKTSYIPGEVYILEYYVLNQIGTPAAYGMQSVLMGAGNVDAGTLGAPVTPGTQASSSGGYNFVEHSTPSTSGIWQIRWTAPSVGFGDVEIYAAGIAANGNGGTSGDEVTAPFSFTFPEECIPTVGTDTQTACGSYTWIDGIEYTASNNSATQTLMNAAGCDSVVTLDLTVNTVDVSVTNTDPALMANAANAAYQWIDCDAANAIVNGATSQSFVPSANGNYAVIVTENGCSDTSVCNAITTVGLDEMELGTNFTVQPNPTTQSIIVDLGKVYDEVDVQILNALGQIVSEERFEMKDSFTLEIIGEPGVYHVVVRSKEGKTVKRIVKQ